MEGQESDTAERSAERPPEKLGRFEMRSELGRGGMGVVYEVWDTTLKRKAAVKLLRLEGAALDLDEARERLLREAQAMAGITHPNVITVYEVGEWDDRVFIVMELVEARDETGTLTRWLAARPRSWRDVLAIFTQAGRGLAAAHARGLVHRDFKPDNVLVDGDGTRARH
jgi:eukaryotic-like serine/threonine-protein kinase